MTELESHRPGAPILSQAELSLLLADANSQQGEIGPQNSEPRFPTLTPLGLDQLTQLSFKHQCIPGEVLFLENEGGDTIYFILSGQAAVVKGEFQSPTILGYRQAGDILGEMAVLENQPRSASVVALSPLQLLCINRGDFLILLRKSPELGQVLMRTLSSRLRQTSDEVRQQAVEKDSLDHQLFQLQGEIQDMEQIQESLRLERERLQSQIVDIKALEARLREQALRDSLTGLYNRRYLEETLGRELQRALRSEYPLSLIMLDIDHFKRLNDNFGHKAGDLMLKALGQLLNANIRQGDIGCRYGGEEFLLIMPGASQEIAYQRAEALRLAFEHLRVPYEDQELNATISLGVTTAPDVGNTVDQVILSVDAALYASKHGGRNRVTLAPAHPDDAKSSPRPAPTPNRE